VQLYGRRRCGRDPGHSPPIFDHDQAPPPEPTRCHATHPLGRCSGQASRWEAKRWRQLAHVRAEEKRQIRHQHSRTRPPTGTPVPTHGSVNRVATACRRHLLPAAPRNLLHVRHLSTLRPDRGVPASGLVPRNLPFDQHALGQYLPGRVAQDRQRSKMRPYPQNTPRGGGCCNRLVLCGRGLDIRSTAGTGPLCFVRLCRKSMVWRNRVAPPR
jgi:hypothetical protein